MGTSRPKTKSRSTALAADPSRQFTRWSAGEPTPKGTHPSFERRRERPDMAEATQTLESLSPGDRFAGFHLRRELGRGAVGRVFLASQAGDARAKYVLKISPSLLGESRCLARISHPNIVPVLSVH